MTNHGAVILDASFALSPKHLSQLLDNAKIAGNEIELTSGASKLVPEAIIRAVADHNAEVRANAANTRVAKLKAMSPKARAVQGLLRDPDFCMEYYNCLDETGKPKA